MLAQIASAEPLRELSEQNEGVQECLNARVCKAQTGRALVAGGHRLLDGAQRLFAEDAVVAHALGLEQPAIGRKSDCAQLRQIVQASTDPEVISVVDGRLGAQGVIFLVILLDTCALVIDVQGWRYIVRDHPGAEPCTRMAPDPAVEDKLDLFWAAEIEVLADHLFEEQPSVDRLIEHLGQGELGLQD
jgi:hypothetical protein